MPATLESLTAKVRGLAVEIVPGDPESVITVEYSPPKHTRNQMRRYRELAENEDKTDLIYEAFFSCVKSWDFRPAEGKEVIPLTAEVIDAEVDIEVISRIVEAITEDQSPKEATTT